MKGCAVILLGALLFMVPWSEAQAETQIYNGREMERVGCSLTSPQECVTSGGRRVDDVGIWVDDELHWQYTDIDTPANPAVGPYITASSFVRGTVLRQAPAANVAHRSGRNGAFRADMFYNTFEGEFTEGTTIGMNPSIVFGDTVEFAIRIPLHMTDIDGADLKRYHYGADASLTINMSDNFALGAHGSYTRDHIEDADFSDDAGYINGGPYASLLIPLGSARLTLGGLLEYGTPEDSDNGNETTVAVGAANLGLPLGDSVGVNVYGMYWHHLDSDLSDYNFVDAGAELAMALGDTWAVQVGGRTVLGLDHLDSYEAYLGSEWAF